MTTLEAIIDQDGRVSLRRGVTLPAERRAILVVLDEPPVADADGGDERAGSGLECALMSEAALAEIWDTPEEEEHWAIPERVAGPARRA